MDAEKLKRSMEYPNWFMGVERSTLACPHGFFFDRRRRECRNCAGGLQCMWLNHCEDVVDRGGEDSQPLQTALTIAYHHIAAKVAVAHHDRRVCKCDSCAWLRQSRYLVATG